MAQLEAQKARPKPRWEEGASYRCVVSTSPGYKVGVDYICHKGADGLLYLHGSDGFDDLCSMLVSGFIKSPTE